MENIPAFKFDKTTNFRLHRGTLKESLKTSVKVSSMEELCQAINNGFAPIKISIEDIQIKPQCYDERIKQYSYMVFSEKYGVFGFASQE